MWAGRGHSGGYRYTTLRRRLDNMSVKSGQLPQYCECRLFYNALFLEQAGRKE